MQLAAGNAFSPTVEAHPFQGKLGIIQRVLPAYRAPFFDALAEVCRGGLSVLAGQPHPDDALPFTGVLEKAVYFPALNRQVFSVKSPFYVCWQSGLLRWLKSWQPDALVVEANSRYLSSRLAVRWMHARGRPVIGWGLGAPPLSGPLAGLRAWERLNFLRSLDGVISYSRRGAEEYGRVGFPASRIFVALNAVKPRPAAPPPERPPAGDRRPTLLFVGRLQARKRIDNLLRACASLPKDLQPRVWVVGDGPARQEFEALAEAIYPQAEFPGARQGAELEPFFKQADLFVLPGTGGLAVQEAMAYGLPVIVAEGDGTQNDLVRAENGWLVPPDDQEALALALRGALSDVGRLRRMGQESYRIVAEEANLQAMVEVFLRALESVCA